MPWYHHHSRQGCAVWLFKPELRTDTTKGKTASNYNFYNRNCTEKLNYFICTEGILQIKFYLWKCYIYFVISQSFFFSLKVLMSPKNS